MNNSIIQNIITKKILKEASSDELVMLESWRESSVQNENLYQEYVVIWEATTNYTPVDFQGKAESAYQKHINLLKQEESKNEDVKVIQLPKSTNPEITKPNLSKEKSSKIFSIKQLSAIAAIFVFAFGAYIVFNSMQSISVSAEHGVAFASLEDGSSIWLDEGSTLTYKKGFGEKHRNLKLEGKAFFDVERNESIPFNITSNDLNVVVLGTSFTIDTKSGENAVAVKSGKVSVAINDNKVTLSADEKVSFENDEFVHEKVSNDDMIWRNSDLSFNNARLDQVIADINLYHGDKIVLESDIKNLDCPFTSKSLTNTTFENIIEILKITYDLEVVENQENGTIALSISDCK